MKKLIIGLGNPGLEYRNTRHNVGFMFLDFFTKKKSITNFKTNKKLECDITEYKQNNNSIIFLKPSTYMNLSGNSISKVIKYYKVRIEDIIIIYDDVSLDIGTLKIKSKGSSGGHNGIKDIIAKLKSEEFKRIKIGINNSNNKVIRDFVLKQFSMQDIEKLDYIFKRTESIVDAFIQNKDWNYIMSTFN